MADRKDNERRFSNWDELPDGGRRYYQIRYGRVAGYARYVTLPTDKSEGFCGTQGFTTPTLTHQDPSDPLRSTETAIERHQQYSRVRSIIQERLIAPGITAGALRRGTVKVVDANEVTLSLVQEIYDDNGHLLSIHQKYPEDTGHQDV